MLSPLCEEGFELTFFAALHRQPWYFVGKYRKISVLIPDILAFYRNEPRNCQRGEKASFLIEW